MYRYSLDMENFLRLLEKLPEQKNRQVSEGTAYLLQSLLAPRMIGQTVFFRDLDFSRFTVEDTMELASIGEDLESSGALDALVFFLQMTEIRPCVSEETSFF